jgi:hypothetical protein
MSKPSLTKKQAQQAVDRLQLPPGASFADLQRLVEAAYGKPIEFKPLSDRLLARCTGLWVDRHTHGTVYYRPLDPIVYLRHSNFHEFGHILLGHKGCSLLDIVDVANLGDGGLGGAIKSIRMRDLNQHPEEQEAEQVALLLAHRLLARPVSPEHEVF